MSQAELTTPMRVLVLGRLFSGLKDSVAGRSWNPGGVPAFYKLIEGLQARPGWKLETILACKEADARFARTVNCTLAAAGAMTVLAWRRPSGGRLPRFDLLFNEVSHLASVLLQAMRTRPDVVYATYAMLFPAAILARVSRLPVVLRLMGIFPHQRTLHRAHFALHRWALRSPFRAVVCTEDGSDPAAVLPRLIHPASELMVRLNGCDAPLSEPHATRGETLTVLFVGRLEPYKGCDVFVEAALQCLRQTSMPARFVVIGDGSMRRELEERVRSARQETAIAFTGAVAHAEVARHLAGCDIYISVNFNGNLSNANLEALAAGACLVIPSSDPALPVDTATDTLIPSDAAIRYDRRDPAGSLAQTLHDLIADRGRIEACRKAARLCAGRLLKPWSERIEADIALLRRVAENRGESEPMRLAAGPHS
ncbi:MAG: glycosyltransferase [Pseudorhodoplanes sp.]|nr:MAG: glycosyltransferase [Pseudorhodoplanes sp.]